ncbi:MAG TPA: MBL fold metallo-hydrolase [Clostridia bacterium]|nr:MBL fold metallo-hydrolase [Clostridia bacterium]
MMKTCLSSMKIRRIVVGPLKTNCYLIKGNPAIVIDPGAEGEKIINLLAAEGCQPGYILATHGHFDHVAAVNQLKKAFPQSQFLISQKDQSTLKQSGLLAPLFGQPPLLKPPQPDGFLNQFSLPGWKVIPTPGHSPGGSSFLLKDQDKIILFSGDTLFEKATGRYDFPGGNQEQLKQSLKKLMKLPVETEVYPGHGKPFPLAKALEFLPELLAA